MKRTVAALIIGLFVVSIVNADVSQPKTEEDWDTAAKVAIEKIEWHKKLMLVLDADLSLQAREALKHWRTTILENELPLQDKYVLPEGYLRVRKFEAVNDGFEVTGTVGPIPKGALLNCGVTTTFLIRKGADGAWTQSGPSSEVIC